MTAATSSREALADLVRLSRAVGRPDADLVIVAEGNTSVRTPGRRMFVKATGARLETASESDFVEVDLDAYAALLGRSELSDAEVAEQLDAAVVTGDKRPSVESLLHAVCLTVPGVDVVAHTHPTVVNAVLCSARPEVLLRPLFPDQVVVLGRHPLLVPYVDPGLALARSVAGRLVEHVAAFGRAPKVIYLVNHGMFALGATADEVLQVTRMAVKVARVLVGSAAFGGPAFLSDADADRIDTRPDEEYRRRLLHALATPAGGEAS